MILYVNGDGHTTAAEAVVPFRCAGDDPKIAYMKDVGHPNNVSISWGWLLSLALKNAFVTQAKHTNTNDIILTQVNNWIDDPHNQTEKIIIIQWSANVSDYHDNIWQLHQKLLSQNIKHVFFNGVDAFTDTKVKYDWGINYIDPYKTSGTYTATLLSNGYETVDIDSPYFGKDANVFWHKTLLSYIIQNKLI